MKKKIDPKELGIPNINFSIYNSGDSREREFKQQRLKRGFDDSETWSLCDTIANFTIPRLEVYIDTAKKIEAIDSVEKLNKILIAFQLVVRDNGARNWTQEEVKQVNKGLKIFEKEFLNLWW